ncbi:MAG: hypothetical protein HN790_03540 [Methylococcales bacterium]|jgi:cell division transport system permease protein|nr:hypothetical protein [Methylococcales bacterium]
MKMLKFMLARHVQAFVSTLGRLFRKPLNTLLTALVMGATLTLPSLLLYSFDRFQEMSDGWSELPSFTVFLKDNVTEKQALTWQTELQKQAVIDHIAFENKDQALKAFRENTLLTDLADITGTNPLPHLLLITVKSSQRENIPELMARLEKHTLVDSVVWDQHWIDQLSSAIHLVQRLSLIISGFLCIVVLLVIGNTIRLEIENKRQEIEVMKLLGATAQFIQRPLIYLGAWLGFFAGLLAICLSALAIYLLAPAIADVAAQYQLKINWVSVNFAQMALLLICSTILGFLGAWIAVLQHLRRIELSV